MVSAKGLFYKAVEWLEPPWRAIAKETRVKDCELFVEKPAQRSKGGPAAEWYWLKNQARVVENRWKTMRDGVDKPCSAVDKSWGDND
jgi:hypothetical protein